MVPDPIIALTYQCFAMRLAPLVGMPINLSPLTVQCKVQALVYDILPSRCRKAMLGVWVQCTLPSEPKINTAILVISRLLPGTVGGIGYIYFGNSRHRKNQRHLKNQIRFGRVSDT